MLPDRLSAAGIEFKQVVAYHSVDRKDVSDRSIRAMESGEDRLGNGYQFGNRCSGSAPVWRRFEAGQTGQHQSDNFDNTT